MQLQAARLAGPHCTRHSSAHQVFERCPFKADYEKTVPMAKAATPDDVAEMCVWLLEGGDVVTGESIFVDSGMHPGFGLGPR